MYDIRSTSIENIYNFLSLKFTKLPCSITASNVLLESVNALEGLFTVCAECGKIQIISGEVMLICLELAYLSLESNGTLCFTVCFEQIQH